MRTRDAFFIGAMVSLREIELHEGLYAYTQGAVRDALKDIVGVQFRNLATVGGSIWGRFGFSDVLTMFLAMDTYVELFQGGIIPLQEFAEKKPDRDVLVRLIVKKTPGVYAYASVRNQRTDSRFLHVQRQMFPVHTGFLSVRDRAEQSVSRMRKDFSQTESQKRVQKQFAKWVETKSRQPAITGAVQHTAHALQVRFAIG